MLKLYFTLGEERHERGKFSKCDFPVELDFLSKHFDLVVCIVQIMEELIRSKISPRQALSYK